MSNLDYGYSRFEGLVRRFSVSLRMITSEKNYYLFTSFLKRLRALFSKKVPALKKSDPILSHLAPNLKGRVLKVCITHDVDSKECSDQLLNLLRIDKNYSIRPTVNFLTQGSYSLTSSLIDAVLSIEGELGLHGDIHDLYFCCRKESDIRVRLQKMLEHFPGDIQHKSFRHPGFGMTQKLASVLADSGFSRDSSLKGGRFFGNHDSLSVPYFLSDTNILEVRTILSDDSMIREKKLNNTDQLELISYMARATLEVDGVLNLNFHPGIVAADYSHYENIIKSLYGEFNLTFLRLRDVEFKNDN